MTTLKNKVYNELKSQINNLELIPGTQLIETEISKKMGVSRTPVREAIRMLVDEGLAVTLSPRITVVKSIIASDVEEIYQVRSSLETLALEMSIGKIKHEAIDLLYEEYETTEYSYESAYELDVKTHNIWIQSSDNKRLIGILDDLDQEIIRYRHYSHQVPHREAKSMEEHRQILEAIKDGNLLKARTYLLMHLENTKNNILNAMNIQQKN